LGRARPVAAPKEQLEEESDETTQATNAAALSFRPQLTDEISVHSELAGRRYTGDHSMVTGCLIQLLSEASGLCGPQSESARLEVTHDPSQRKRVTPLLPLPLSQQFITSAQQPNRNVSATLWSRGSWDIVLTIS
jgi:hypothetical protein